MQAEEARYVLMYVPTLPDSELFNEFLVGAAFNLLYILNCS